MGAWDYGPLDNDDASDFWYNMWLDKNPLRMLKATLADTASRNANERRAAASFVAFLLKFDRRSMASLKKGAQKAIQELAADSDFLGSWTEPEAVKRSLKKELKDLK